MTVKQLADELKVSPQAIYQRLKKHHIQIQKLINADTKELTADGEYSIRKLFTKQDGETKPTKQAMVEEYTKQLDELRKENAELVDKLKAAEDRIKALEADKAFYAALAEKAQSIQEQMLNRFLPGPGGTSSGKLTWRERITGRRAVQPEKPKE